MIGRQRLYITQAEMHRLLTSCEYHLDHSRIAEICNGADGYSEAFFRLLGAEKVHSFDRSNYETPTHTHDMNDPIEDGFKEAYSTVLDGGSLEHIFNFPVAIKNCMEMVRVGGHYLAITPANNFFGHGFYQFSPELYFTVLSEENGFEVQKIIAFEETSNPVWYAVRSPRDAAQRVTLSNSRPVYLLVIAKKLANLPIFARSPQQSDYVALWNADAIGPATVEHGAAATRPLAVHWAKMVLPPRVRKLIRRALERPARKTRGFDSRFFERMEWPAGAESLPYARTAGKGCPPH